MLRRTQEEICDDKIYTVSLCKPKISNQQCRLITTEFPVPRDDALSRCCKSYFLPWKIDVCSTEVRLSEIFSLTGLTL